MPFCTKCGSPVAAADLSCRVCGATRFTSPTGTAATSRPVTASPRARGATLCQNCGRSFGIARSCQFCKQVEGLPTGVTLASPARRLGGYLLEPVLVVVTLAIGWVVWALFTFERGQTPAKQMLGMRVVNLSEGGAAGFGKMFVREFIAKPVIGILGVVAIVGIIADMWLLWDQDTQELWDKIVDTIVVIDPMGTTS